MCVCVFVYPFVSQCESIIACVFIRDFVCLCVYVYQLFEVEGLFLYERSFYCREFMAHC